MQPIRTALCSFGMSGKIFHAPFIHRNPHYQLCAVWERSKKIAADLYPGIISYDNYEAILADPDIDLVVVNTPNITHFDYTKRALLAGKHVVVEKPFTVTVAEAIELEELAVKQDRILSVYQNRRFDSDIRTVRRVIEEGSLGQIVEAEIHYDRYNLVLSPKPHKEIAVQGTGVLYDLGPHVIDQALVLFGMPDALFADITHQRPGSQVDDYFEIIFFYPQLRVRLKSGYVVMEPVPAYAIHGTSGSFLKPRADPQEIKLNAGLLPEDDTWGVEDPASAGLLHTNIDGQPKKLMIRSEAGNYGAFYEGLYDAIQNNIFEDKFVPASAGTNVIRIIEAAYKSRDEKRIIAL
ncbi:Gfo/Idh/MocA family oxidoreductase [Pseudobacter ginsenosidimutans]|uniref:Putative dehydrogenase n=1 Tax=Pseudobacter ginsenosidimutans TaxID=661488 RepID=A0A4Q7MZR5_9BACT|nr:Gfo/Idh/MocA family oxidoreductase [Pseudobacter ginsenosidimutans]QEC43416.1 oxidoreductase [Pseudobacter ginsenosidimutans]RZS74791.1 putative dehydrogenase [Pseudobacter ginsenosidimutans]